jgi:hypothetical protein
MSGKVSPWGNAVGFVPPMTRSPDPVPPGNDFVRQNALVPGTTQTGQALTPPGTLVGPPPATAEAQATQPSVRYDANKFNYSDPKMFSAWEQNERQQITALYSSANGMPT